MTDGAWLISGPMSGLASDVVWEVVWEVVCEVVSGPSLKVPIKHHHLHFVAHSHMALRVAQHDQTIGLHH